MNSYAILLLGGDVSSNVVIYGGYTTGDLALAGIINTGKPWAYQVFQCFGQATNPPPGSYSPIDIAPGMYVAVTAGFDKFGNSLLYGYGQWASAAAANAWIASAGIPGAYSIGQVSPAI